MESAPWVEEKVTVRTMQGLHARPAREVWAAARKFTSEVHIVKGPVDADAKSIFDIMTLDAPCGTELTVRARGTDAADAVRAVGQVISTEFKE